MEEEFQQCKSLSSSNQIYQDHGVNLNYDVGLLRKHCSVSKNVSSLKCTSSPDDTSFTNYCSQKSRPAATKVLRKRTKLASIVKFSTPSTSITAGSQNYRLAASSSYFASLTAVLLQKFSSVNSTLLFVLLLLLSLSVVPIAQSAKTASIAAAAATPQYDDDLTSLQHHSSSNQHPSSNEPCNHHYPKEHEIIHGAFIEPHHVMKKRSIDQQLRIHLHYDESVESLDSEQRDLIKNTVLPNAVEYWQEALKVRRTENAIVLNRRCPNQQVYYKPEDPYPYCRDHCEEKTMCGEVEVPEDHLDVCRVCDVHGRNCGVRENSTAGIGIEEADFVFYVSARQTNRCRHGFTVAYAAHCQQESALDRPIAGHANLCPKSISTKPQELDTLISTVKHEILHALGFSVSLYAFFRDDNGDPLTKRDSKGKPPLNEQMQARQWSSRTIRKIERTEWKVRDGFVKRELNMVVTPRVVEEARRHFNCPDLEGAELEDQGEEGTALTHWEKRIFENEAMTGTHTQNPVYSRITLALMEDTGWYRANYDKAQNLVWGHGLGCDFVKKSCMEWISSAQQRGEEPLPYCNKVKAEPLETQCTDDFTSVALCNLVKYNTELPFQYRNFEQLPSVPRENVSYYGGSVLLADYCPYIQEFTWRANSVIIRGSHCYYEENNPETEKNFALEEYGNESKCFYHTKEMWEERNCHQKRQWQHWGSGCYKYDCSDGLLRIIVSNRTFTCAYTGQELRIQLMANGWLHQGGLKCPNCTDICDDCSGLETFENTIQEYPQDALRCGTCHLINHFSSVLLFTIVFQNFI